MELGKSGPPTSLDLLRLRWTFTQEYLLSPDAFERECDRRGLNLRAGQLEELDRVGVLRPLYEMDASVATAQQLRGATREMNSALEQGLVRRRAGPTFSPWPRSSITGELQYSIYQLLAIPVLRRFISSMTVKKPVDLSKGIRWTLQGQNFEDIAPGHRLPLVDEKLIVWLSVLEPIYRPRVVGQITLPFLPELPEERQYSPEELTLLVEKHREELFEYRRTARAGELLEWLQASADDIANQVEVLLRQADRIDPLGDWLQVVRLAPGRWKHLQRDALVAIDHRIAAETLLRFLHQLADEGVVPKDLYGFEGALAQRYSVSRLSTDDAKRDGILTDFDLSPHPLSLVVIEGKTEQMLAPRIMEELGLPPPPWPIRLHNGQSADAKLDWMYRFISAMEVYEEIPGGFRPSRPIPHIFVISDPEGTRATANSRESARRKIVDHLCRDAEEATGRPIPLDLFDSRVRIEAWDTSFEFAHFSDPELAAALRAQRPDLDDRLEGELEQERLSGLPRISSVWFRLKQQGSVDRDIDKIALANALWPSLRAHLRERIQDEAEVRKIPIASTLLDAYEPILEYPWGHFQYVPAARRNP